MKKLTCLYLFFVALLPVIVSAQQSLRNIDDVARRASSLGTMVITLTISLAVIWIIIGVFRYVIAGGKNEDDRKKGGMNILYGVVGLFVILSIWGLVAILRNSFRTDDTMMDSEIQRASRLPRIDGVNVRR